MLFLGYLQVRQVDWEQMRTCVSILLATALCAGCTARKVPTVTTADGILARTGKAVQPRGATASMPPGISLEQPLSADAAAAIAVWNNAQLRADLAAIGIAEADFQEASLLLRNPRLDLLVPIGAKPFELLFNFPLEIFLQRPRRIAVSEQALNQLAQSLIQNAVNTARDAQIAHADLVQAGARVALAEESSALRDRIAELTAARLRAGDIAELETIAAKTEAGTAREQLSRLRHEVVLARQRLCFTLGLPPKEPKLQVTAAPAAAAPPPALDALLEKAMASRADLRAIELSIATATSRAKWERSRFLWLTAQLSSKGVGTNGILTGPGLSVEAPVFNRNQGGIARAEAEVQMASKQYLALKQRIALEAADARGQLVQAQDVLATLREAVLPPLERGAALAEQQYKKGDVAYLFVLEQTRGLVDARQRVIDSEAAIRRAQAQLERSVGSR